MTEGNGRYGFTLIELMIVVAIISILALVAVPNFAKYRQTARDSAVMVLLAEIGSLQREYRADHGVYLTCPLNPAVSGGAWVDAGPWRKIDFRPMQKIYGYQFEVRAGPDKFVATAYRQGKPVFTARHDTYDVKREFTE